MSDIFISYSRQDKEFVGKLREALIDQKQEVWIDWESIPPSQAWWGEIQKGIAKANNFVVILSPNSMGSPICQMEIEYARQLGKRIIPVLHLDYKRDDVVASMAMRLAKPEQETVRILWSNRQIHDLYDANESLINHINYFFFRAEDDFEKRFEDLFVVIRTDHEHKEQHTTLELRAREWERREKNTSFLLFDDELEQAEEWLSKSETKEPPPTSLHQEYIQASRMAEAERNAQAERIQQQIRDLEQATAEQKQVAETATRLTRRYQMASLIAVILIVLAILAVVFATNRFLQAEDKANQAATREAQALQVAGTAQGDATLAQAQIDMAETQLAEVQAAQTQAAQDLAAAQAEAEEQAKIAESRRLAAEAQSVLANGDGNAELAALLAIRGLKTVYTEQADAQLVRAVDRLYTQKNLKGIHLM